MGRCFFIEDKVYIGFIGVFIWFVHKNTNKENL